jgi:dihydroneopterin aldolase
MAPLDRPSTDAVFVRGIEFEANHGYTAAERKSTRRFRVDVELRLSLSDAADSDRIGDTVDYRTICDRIVTIGTETTFRLLEGLAGQMIAAIHELYPRVDVELQLEKLAPPCRGAPASSGVRLVKSGTSVR